MYDELIKNLRETDFSDGCPCGAENLCKDNDCLIWQAADAIENLDNRLNLHRQGKIGHWIPVTERLPDVGKKVLVLAYANDVLTARMRKQTENGYPVFECNGIFLEMAKPGRITHWMPLPQPPKDGES